MTLKGFPDDDGKVITEEKKLTESFNTIFSDIVRTLIRRKTQR